MKLETENQVLETTLQRMLEAAVSDMSIEEIKCLDWFTCDTDEFISNKTLQVA